MSYEEEDTCMSYEAEDTCMPYEEEDTCMPYEEAYICRTSVTALLVAGVNLSNCTCPGKRY
jgi:hypothetical protein